MKRHVKKHGDEYLLSPAATLTLIACAVHDPEAGPAGTARARRTIDQVVAVARVEKFEQLDILETMLAAEVDGKRLLPVFDALVKCVGAWRVTQIVRQVLAEARGDKT